MTFTNNTSNTDIIDQAYATMCERMPVLKEAPIDNIKNDIKREGQRISDAMGDEVQHIGTLTIKDDEVIFKCTTKEAEDKLIKHFELVEDNAKVSIIEDGFTFKFTNLPEMEDVPEGYEDVNFEHMGYVMVATVFTTLGATINW